MTKREIAHHGQYVLCYNDFQNVWQKASTCRKGLTLYHHLQTISGVSDEINTEISHDDYFFIFKLRFAFNLRVAIS